MRSTSKTGVNTGGKDKKQYCCLLRFCSVRTHISFLSRRDDTPVPRETTMALSSALATSITNLTEDDVATLLVESSIEEAPENLPTSVRIIIVIVGMILVGAITGGNGLVILLVFKFQQLRNASNYLLLGMASSDFTVGIALLSSIIIRFNPHLLAESFNCLIYWSSSLSCILTSCWLLFFVSFDRYLKIVLPLRFYTILNEKIALAIIGGVYIYTAIIVYALPLTVANKIDPDLDVSCYFQLTQIFHPTFLQFIFFGNVFSPIFLICLMYIKILRVVMAKLAYERRIYGRLKTPAGKSLLSWKRELRTIKTLTMLLGLCMFGFFPIWSVLLAETYDSTYQAGLSVRSFVGYLMFLNSAMNPIIYCFRSAKFRHCAKLLICGRGTPNANIKIFSINIRRHNTVEPL